MSLDSRHLRTGARGLGQVLLTLGYVLLLFVVYEVWITDLQTSRSQEVLTDELREQWGPEPGRVDDPITVTQGQPFAFLHIPRLAPDHVRAVVEGTSAEDLAQGPGHYEGTALPGRPGNFAVAGHRVGRGSPFREIDELRPGDPIVVETADAWFVYRVLGDRVTGDLPGGDSPVPGQRIVDPADVSVIAPTPGGPPDAAPSGIYLTLTTCHPEYSARQRLIIHAVLDGPPIARADAIDGPPALNE